MRDISVVSHQVLKLNMQWLEHYVSKWQVIKMT